MPINLEYRRYDDAIRTEFILTGAPGNWIMSVKGPLKSDDYPLTDAGAESFIAMCSPFDDEDE